MTQFLIVPTRVMKIAPIAVVATVVAALGLQVSAAGEPGSPILGPAHEAAGTPSADRQVSAEVLGSVAGQVATLGGPDAFAGLTIDQAQGLVVTYWYGDVPKDVADYAATRPQGVVVLATGGAPYSRSELQAAARSLMSAPIARTLKIQAAAARPDGSGLDLTLAGPGPTAAQQAELAGAAGIAATAFTYRPNTPVDPLSAETRSRE